MLNIRELKVGDKISEKNTGHQLEVIEIYPEDGDIKVYGLLPDGSSSGPKYAVSLSYGLNEYNLSEDNEWALNNYIKVDK